MILTETKKKLNGTSAKIQEHHINTLMPRFEYRNGKGQIVMPVKSCIQF